VARQRVAAPKSLGRLVFQERQVGDEVTAGQLELDDAAVALAARVARADHRAQVAAVRCFDESQAVVQLAEARDTRDPGHVVVGCLHHHRRHPLEGPLKRQDPMEKRSGMSRRHAPARASTGATMRVPPCRQRDVVGVSEFDLERFTETLAWEEASEETLSPVSYFHPLLEADHPDGLPPSAWTGPPSRE